MSLMEEEEKPEQIQKYYSKQWEIKTGAKNLPKLFSFI